MRIFKLWSLLLALFPTAGFAQPAVEDQVLIAQLQLAESAAGAILNFQQGDVASLIDARAYFTPSGWSDFMKGLTGSLDQDGGPNFSSTFVPSGASLDVKKHQDSISLTIPGVLKHESRNQHGSVSRTEYRAEIDIRTSANPHKLESIKQRTCGGAAIMSACR